MKDYSELIAECAQRTNMNNLVERAEMFSDMAVRTLSRRLRLVEQETEATLTTNQNGDAELPQDFEEMKGVFVNGKKIQRASLASMYDPYERDIYAIAGRKLKSKYTQTQHQCHYFASIPKLSQPDNFLVQKEPEICLYALLFQAFAANGDIDKAAQAASWLDRLVQEANDNDQSKRQGGVRVNLAAIAP